MKNFIVTLVKHTVVLSSPLVQFNLLHSKFHLCSVPTRALLLSAYIKFINLFPETKATIQEVLRCDSQIRNSDVELQQRAVEYLKLSSIASTDVLVSPGPCWTKPNLCPLMGFIICYFIIFFILLLFSFSPNLHYDFACSLSVLGHCPRGDASLPREGVINPG